jgi:hypothetical protein
VEDDDGSEDFVSVGEFSLTIFLFANQAEGAEQNRNLVFCAKKQKHRLNFQWD